MCDVVCSDFLDLVNSYEARLNNDAKHAVLYKSEIETAYGYIHAWPQRQCMCLYRDAKNFERFNYVVQSMIFLCVHHMKHMGRLIADYKRLTASAAQAVAQAQANAAAGTTSTDANDAKKSTAREQTPPQSITSSSSSTTKITTTQETEKKCVAADVENTVNIDKNKENESKSLSKEIDNSKINTTTADDILNSSPTHSQCNSPPPPPPPLSSTSSAGATQQLSMPSSSSCSSTQQHTEEPWILPEVEKLILLVSKVFLINFPLYIAYKHGTHARLDDISAEEAQHLAIYCDLHDNEIPVFLLRNISLFCNSGGFAAMMMCFEEPDLPVSIAHAITAAVSNIKLWLNYSCIVQLFVPLRSRVLQYMCKLSDQNLRQAQTRAMADFVWSAIRDPLDASVSFDIEGLALAFKYFTSTTLTMRLAGMAQINAHINLFNEICTTETVGEVEIVGQKIANWLTENQIIQHLFGPNLHVEVIKQAHVVLNFLAVENQITEEHIKLIWQATQLKHCSKTIFDILPSLVKNLAARPAMHLYSLLCHMDPKDHTEQSIYIASALTKSIWSRDSSRAHLSLMQDHLMANTASSSDSGSLDGSNSDDEHGNGDDSSIGSGGRKSPIDIEAINSPPCKQARRRHIICDPTEEKTKLSAAELRLLGSKVDLKIHNHHRIVNIIDNSTSDDDDDEDDDDDDLQSTSHALQMHHRKKLRKRSKNAVPLKRLAHNIVEAIWDGSGAAGVGDADVEGDGDDDDEPSSDEADDVDGDMLNDSDECSDDEGQDVPKAVLKHLQGEGPYIRAIAETHISELLSGAENEGSYSSPMSNKSEKNLADFDDEDISPCEEELAQLVSTHAARVPHGCHMPPAFAAAAAAMAAAQSAMAKQKTEANFAAAAAAVAVAAVATGNAQQSLEAMRQQASAVSASAAGSPALLKRGDCITHLKSGDSDIDIRDLSKDSPKGSSFGGANSSTSSAGGGGGSGSSGGSGPTTLQPTFKINDVCQPGNTLLWDLLQDDKIHLLGESLALETEKALATLLCFSMDRLLRMKFIEGCLQNLAANRSVIVSLRLLPKLFASFQQFRPSDTHQVTMWAERQHRMMYHFFNNIKFYAKRHAELLTNKTGNATQNAGSNGDNADTTGRVPIIYSHKTQVSVRLHFLSSIYSSHGSPKNFRLSLEQVDALWEWLAHDPECADCYFSWLQSQAKGDDQHGLGIETLQHLYLKKLPELRPEEFSMVALGLFQQLCTLARMAIAQYEKHTDSISTSSTNIVGMIHLWKIALRAHNTEVSLAAIQYINMFYMGQQLRLEKEFVTQCMDNLMQAANALEESADDESSMKQAVSALESIQRGLMLLNTHLETFRRRYAFHLRRWAIEGKDIGSHINLKGEGAGPAIRIVLQPAGINEKSILHMHACDLIADLKAEISKWWENLQGISNAGTQAPVLGLLLSEGPLRIITQGQELTSDYDERSLGDAGFKDNQIVYVSLGGRSGARRKELNLDHPSMQPPPPKDCLPTVLLLQPRYFEQLFRLMQTLGGMRPNPSNLQLHTKAQLLSRRVWDILAILPTNSQILDLFKSLKEDLNDLDTLNEKKAKKESDNSIQAHFDNKVSQIEQKLQELLDPSNLQKFMYALHIVESLVLSGVYQNKTGSSACCNAALNGNVMPMEQHARSSSSSTGNGNGKTLKRAGSKRRNSNSTESVSSMKPASTASGADSHKESTDSSSPLKDLKTISPSSTTSIKSPITATTQSTAMESEPSEAGSSSGNGNDKENSPVKMPIKRQKRSNSSDNEKESPTLQKESLSNASTAIATAAGSTIASPTVPVPAEVKWAEIYIKCGGLKHLYKIFISGKLQQSSNPKDPLNEWRHDCLALLLRILCLIGFEELQADEMHVVISRPHKFMLELMEVDPCLRRLSSILNDEAYQNYASFAATAPFQYHQYCHLRTGFWGRAQVVQFAMNIMVSFVHASSEARTVLWTKPDYCNWVLKFILEDPEPAVRREICAGLYRICLGNAQSYQVLLVPLLRKLISFLPVAEKMTSYPQHTTQQYLFSDEGKEPYGPACRDYFWLLARLVDTLTPEMLKASFAEACADQPNGIDIERLCESVSQSILLREFHETRHGYQDDGLVGLINLMSNLVKYDPTFKFSPNAVQFIDKIFDFLFDMPSPTNRQKPKCKSATSRAAAYDLLVEMCKNCPKNYSFLHTKLLAQHTPGPKQPYPWDYWPRDEGRSECGYVGLTNLGATCYMASCIQHLYMMPQARAAILNVPPTGAQKHEATLLELQRMFAYLLESERKAYNPRSFCRVYQMDHQPLNTGEQKDMAEFFIDLVSKLEEMTPELKDLVKRLFCGTLSNNVVSLDCGHVSRTAEEFYTVRCQVADMRNLQESLDEVTVKDTLEGDNMYTCSQCGKKVRAEKRACFKKLPQILCFNTMRYTFNMITMLKEKVNTHFSFPMRLNMSDYVEKTLMPHQYQEDREKRKMEKAKLTSEVSGDENKNEGESEAFATADSIEEDIEECLEYELVGVTVHTGTADGGHYYSFIKERNMPPMQHERWFLFNDAEVKPFDPSQIAAECFGGEMTSKTYDSVTEKYLDFSFEKTNSAYMLFYERCLPKHLQQRQSELLTIPAVVSCSNNNNNKKNEDEKCKESERITTEMPSVSNKSKNNEEPQTSASTSAILSSSPSTSTSSSSPTLGQRISTEIMRFIPQLNKELEDWIWQDNRQFLQDRNIFEHTYFNFMWQICGHIPQTLIAQMDVTCMAAKLSVSFFIETFIHAKEKPTMVPWVELLTKQFNANQEACEWFLMHMSVEPWWPVQVLIQCPNQMVRQMFQRLVIHVIQRLRSSHANLYLKIEYDDNDKELVGNASCVTRFIRSLVLLMEHGAKAHLRHLSEYFSLLFEFSRMGEEETLFLLRIGVIKSVADFYLGHKTQDCIDVGSDNEDSSDEALSVDKTRPASLDKMIALVANLVERSRGPDLRLRLSLKDFNAIAGGKGFPFLYQQIRDNINPHQTKHLIHALCRWDDRLANQIITMLFASVAKHTELCSPFFKLLTLLTESQGGPSGLPCFSQLILQRVWDAAECCPQSALEWLAFQAPKNKIAHSWILQSADNWVETFLMAHHNARVRNAAAYLLVSLVPSQPFRTNFRSHSLHKLTTMPNNVYRELNEDAQIVLHNIINLLLRLLRPARTYADIGLHGTSKLTSFFSLLSYCMISKTEKLMIGPYMRALWELFHPRLSEPSVPTHHNKHALLAFWHHSIIDCPENALAVANCPEITRNIAFNYILADHDDAEVVNYNRGMLPAYYGLLRLCCEQSRALTRQLAAHQNLQWAFKNITPHPTQYATAVDELFRLMTLFATRHADATEQEKHEVTTFRRTTLSAYLTSLDARVSWSTLISALKVLVDNDEDRLLVIYNGGIEMCFDALHTLHSMHHEATACHVAGDLQELLNELVLLLTTLRMSTRLDGNGPIVTKQQIEQQAHQLQLLHKQHQQQQQQSQTQSPQQQTSQQQQQKEKKLQQQMQQQQLHLQQLQQQHFLRQQQQQHQTGIIKALPDAVKRLATLLNTYNSPDICRLSLEVLKELVRNPNLDVTGILAPILINCHLTVASAPNAIGPLGPYFPRRGVRTPWTTISKSSPRPPRPMVQMCIPHGELLTKGIDADYDALVDAFYRPYHDFIDVLMRMAVNTNTLNDSLVRLSCLVAIEGAPLHFNLFPKFWVGIYNNKSTHKYAELLIDSQCLVEYVHTVLREARISLRDQFIRTFLEIYYPKIANLLPIARLLYTISYSMHNKEDLDDLCGDLFAIRVIAQCSGIPATVRKQLRGSLKALLYKSSRYKETADNELFAKKKLKLERKSAETKTASEKEEDLNYTIITTYMPSNANSTSKAAAATAAAAEEESNKKVVDKNDETNIEKLKEKLAKSETTKTDKKSLENDDNDDAEDDEQMKPSTSRQTTEQTTKMSTTAVTATTSQNVDVNSESKCAVKKTADERLLEEYEKHMKVLLNVESYIKTILALMQKEETTGSNCGGSGTGGGGGGVGGVSAASNEDNETETDYTARRDVIITTTNTTTTTTNASEMSSSKVSDDDRTTTIRIIAVKPDTSDSSIKTTTNKEITADEKELETATEIGAGGGGGAITKTTKTTEDFRQVDLSAALGAVNLIAATAAAAAVAAAAATTANETTVSSTNNNNNNNDETKIEEISKIQNAKESATAVVEQAAAEVVDDAEIDTTSNNNNENTENNTNTIATQSTTASASTDNVVTATQI